MTEADQANEEIPAVEVQVADTAPVVFTFAGGNDVTIPAIPDAIGAKVIDQALAEDGRPRYKVAYGKQDWFDEGQLAALA